MFCPNAVQFIFTFLIIFMLCVTEKSGKEVMSKGSSGMEVILASLEVSCHSVKFITLSFNTKFTLYFLHKWLEWSRFKTDQSLC